MATYARSVGNAVAVGFVLAVEENGSLGNRLAIERDHSRDFQQSQFAVVGLGTGGAACRCDPQTKDGSRSAHRSWQ